METVKADELTLGASSRRKLRQYHEILQTNKVGAIVWTEFLEQPRPCYKPLYHC